MHKLCLALIGLLFSGSAIAQTEFSNQQAYSGGSSISIATSEEDDNKGDQYFEEAEKNEKRGELYDALTFFGKAAFEYNNAGDSNRYGASLLRLSNIHYLQQHYTEAEQVILNVALKTYSRLGSRTGQMESYNQLGKIYLASNKLTQSMWFFTQQGILARQVKNNTSYIDSILGLVQVKIRKKEYGLATKDIDRAEVFAKTSNIRHYGGQIKQARIIIAEKKKVL